MWRSTRWTKIHLRVSWKNRAIHRGRWRSSLFFCHQFYWHTKITRKTLVQLDQLIGKWKNSLSSSEYSEKKLKRNSKSAMTMGLTLIGARSTDIKRKWSEATSRQGNFPWIYIYLYWIDYWCESEQTKALRMFSVFDINRFRCRFHFSWFILCLPLATRHTKLCTTLAEEIWKSLHYTLTASHSIFIAFFLFQSASHFIIFLSISSFHSWPSNEFEAKRRNLFLASKNTSAYINPRRVFSIDSVMCKTTTAFVTTESRMNAHMPSIRRYFFVCRLKLSTNKKRRNCSPSWHRFA